MVIRPRVSEECIGPGGMCDHGIPHKYEDTCEEDCLFNGNNRIKVSCEDEFIDIIKKASKK